MAMNPESTRAIEKLTKPDAQWRAELTRQQYDVTRRGGTEPAFSGAYWDTKTPGVYRCVACGLPLFESETKYDSGTGWPSFWQPIDPAHLTEHEDRGFFRVRTETRCARCDSHLGHVFDDGPAPTGRRYCMNSAALRLEPAADAARAPGDTNGELPEAGGLPGASELPGAGDLPGAAR